MLESKHSVSSPLLKCGWRSTRRPRIVGGSDALISEFPWMVSVREFSVHKCGGTIINRFWVLTAAHCVIQFSGSLHRFPYYRVKTGVRSFHLDESLDLDIYVAEVHLHPGYKQPQESSNDVALLRLRLPIRYTDMAQPVCLPKSIDDDYEGRMATVVGWGLLSDEEEELSKRLQKVDVPVLNNTICDKWYSEGYEGYMPIEDHQICAGYKEGGKDACYGDSGGPLLMFDKDHFTLIGVVSLGKGCARRHLPGVYSRVSVFVPWILKVSGGLY